MHDMKQKKKEHCVMSRRCFLNWMGMGTLAPIIAPGLVSRSIESHKSGDANMEKAKSQEIAAQTVEFKPEDLVAYCGRYYGIPGVTASAMNTLIIMETAAKTNGRELPWWAVFRPTGTGCMTWPVT
jgi:hypothetical protein